MGTTVITHGYSAPILESAEHDFYLVPLLINLLVIGHRSFPAVSAGNTRRDSFTGQGMTKPVGIIASIRQKLPGLRQSIKQKLPGLRQSIKQDSSAFVVAHLTAGQMEGQRLTEGIADSVEF